jgi:hypothetical protein
MPRPLAIIEDPRRYQPREWKGAGIFFAVFTMGALVRFGDGLPKPWALVLISLLGLVVLSLSYSLSRPARPAESDPDSKPEAN